MGYVNHSRICKMITNFLVQNWRDFNNWFMSVWLADEHCINFLVHACAYDECLLMANIENILCGYKISLWLVFDIWSFHWIIDSYFSLSMVNSNEIVHFEWKIVGSYKPKTNFFFDHSINFLLFFCICTGDRNQAFITYSYIIYWKNNYCV